MTDSTNIQARILLVEDEQSLSAGLVYNLSEEGYAVTLAEDGRKGLELIESQMFDLIILDIMLPFFDGFELAHMVRRQSARVPILMLTAKTGVEDRIHGLEIGADDYLTKPFHLKELLARIKGMLKRKSWYRQENKPTSVYTFGDNEINFDNLCARAGSRQIRLTLLESNLLKYLIACKGKVVTRKELLENVWNQSSENETRTVDVFIMRLRKHFEPTPSYPTHIKSIRSVGYLFSDD